MVQTLEWAYWVWFFTLVPEVNDPQGCRQRRVKWRGKGSFKVTPWNWAEEGAWSLVKNKGREDIVVVGICRLFYHVLEGCPFGSVVEPQTWDLGADGSSPGVCTPLRSPLPLGQTLNCCTSCLVYTKGPLCLRGCIRKFKRLSRTLSLVFYNSVGSSALSIANLMFLLSRNYQTWFRFSSLSLHTCFLFCLKIVRWACQ